MTEKRVSKAKKQKRKKTLAQEPGLAAGPARRRRPERLQGRYLLKYVEEGDFPSALQVLRRAARTKKELSASERNAYKKVAELLVELLAGDPREAKRRIAGELLRLLAPMLSPEAAGNARQLVDAQSRSDPETGVIAEGGQHVGREAEKQESFRADRHPPVVLDRMRRGSRRAPALAPIVVRAPQAAAPSRQPRPEIRRTPHMDISQSVVSPGMSFEIAIFADQSAARADELSTDIVVQWGITLEVQLVTSAHFRVEGSDLTRMVVSEAERLDAEQVFRVIVRPSDEVPIDVVPSLIALFFNNGRPCGSVAR
ncbi:hypothetical protein, partial [Bradyrhizobium guangdongense]|uniref:hypothetical protein n=1 Tax=Bradyrhizobium guangdongense TaxID=1325090 RepID=UPI001319B9B7